jgi:hypothetical protein
MEEQVPTIPQEQAPASTQGSGGSTAPSASPPEVGGSSPSQGSPSTPSAPSQPSWVEDFRKDIPNLPSDPAQARQYLAQVYRDAEQLRPLAPYAYEYQQKAGQFNQWLQQQQTAQQQPKQQGPWYSKWYNPPEWNPAWERLIKQNEDGSLSPVQGAPPDIVAKYLAHSQYQSDQLRKFRDNPYEFIKEPVRHLAQQIAQEEVRRHLGQYQEVNSSKQFVEQNANWIFEMDPNGQRKFQQVVDPRSGQYVNQPVLSPWGQRFQQYVAQEEARQRQRGYMDVEEQKRNALGWVQRDYALYALQNGQKPQSPPVDPRQQSNQQFLQGQGSLPRPGANVNQAQPPVVDGRNVDQYAQDLLRQVEGGALSAA